MAAASATTRPSPVLLGLCDGSVPPAGSCDFQPGWSASKLGGSPDVDCSITLVRPSCGICGAGLMHIVQVYCPLEGSPFQRVIYVFACATKSCWGKSESWKVFRSQHLQVQAKEMQDCNLKQKQECILATRDWCEGAEDWEEYEDMPHLKDYAAMFPLSSEADCASKFQGLNLGEPSPSHPSRFHPAAVGEKAEPGYIPAFKPYYISVVEEKDYLGYEDTGHAQKLLKEYQQREGVDSEQLMAESYVADSCDETYEKSNAEKRDQVFHKFMKRISSCQEQIVRYSWGGQPLFLTCPSSDMKAILPCDNCKGKRIFEFQLMPTLVSMLESGDEDVSVEFGTAIVYTCVKSCWPADRTTPLEEFILLQEDPDQQLFK